MSVVLKVGIVLPLPDKIDFNEWAARFSEAFPDQYVSKPEISDTWITWAERLFLQPAFAEFPHPIELAYPKTDDWRLWASQVIQFLV